MSDATISPAAKSGIAAGSGVGSTLGVAGTGVGLAVGDGGDVGVGDGDGVAVSSGDRVQAARRMASTTMDPVARIPPRSLIGKRVAGRPARRASDRQAPVRVGMLAASRSAISRAFVVP